MVDTLSENGLGTWGGNDAEKLLRVCHPIVMFLSVLTETGQKLLWMSDEDAINEDGNSRSFQNTQQVFMNALSLYTDNEYKVCGFAKPFEKDPFTGDLLSLTDFAAGMSQELCQYYLGRDIKVSHEKLKIVRWLCTASRFLKKVNLIFLKQDSTFSIGNMQLSAKDQSP
jgi:hypothetical protein